MSRKIVFVLVLVMGVLLAGCALFNRAPVARIRASVISGSSPLAVDFDGTDSYDADGEIISYDWDFGDETTKSGPTPSHTFTTTTAHTFTVTLIVTDDAGATGTIAQSIEVLAGSPASPNAPTAKLIATPSYGNAPLLVTFDAAGSRAVEGPIKGYAWDFGDDSSGSGVTLQHEYDPVVTTNYTVTLTVIDNDGATASTSQVVTAFVPEEIPDDPPVASFFVTDKEKTHDGAPPSDPALFEVTFDPSASIASPGHDIVVYHWLFGDGEATIKATDDEVMHVYALSSQNHVFVVTLIVIDDQGLEDSIMGNVTLTLTQ